MEAASEATARPMRILMITSEAVPFAKVGGLADVVPALAAELARRGHDVRLVMPRYPATSRDTAARIPGALGVPMGMHEYWTELLETHLPSTEPAVKVYFIEHLQLFATDAIYARPGESHSPDNLLRFGVLTRAAFQLCRKLSWYPEIVHAHDWPSALAPVYLYTIEDSAPFHRTASVFSIHNLGYQGVFSLDHLRHLPLRQPEIERSGLEFFGQVNSLKAGILCADTVTTVSPRYAREIQDEAYGFGLDGVLRERSLDLYGILNGIDYSVWDSENDPFLPAGFSQQDMRGKAECKSALQRCFGLERRPGAPVVGMIARLVDQKGLAELSAPGWGCLPAVLAELNLQFVVLGTGDPGHEDRLAELARRYDNFAYERTFDERLAHLIEGGSDLFLMPSRYEPCGLNQMYSLRYGTLPIATATGGLLDTIVDASDPSGDGTGFLIAHCTPGDIHSAIARAVRLYHEQPEKLQAMRARAMRRRFDWGQSAAEYEQAYLHAVQRRISR